MSTEEIKLKCLELAGPFVKGKGLSDPQEVVNVANVFYNWINPGRSDSTLTLKEPGAASKRRP